MPGRGKAKAVKGKGKGKGSAKNSAKKGNVQTPDLDSSQDSNGNPGNQRKQMQKPKPPECFSLQVGAERKPVSRKRKGEMERSVLEEQPPKTQHVTRQSQDEKDVTASARYEEEGNVFEISVSGQNEEFRSGNEAKDSSGTSDEETEDSDVDSDASTVLEADTESSPLNSSQRLTNNNAVKGRSPRSRSPDDNSGEQTELERIASFMEQRGLVMMEASKINYLNRQATQHDTDHRSRDDPQRGKNDVIKAVPDEMDVRSVVTIYKSAVGKVPSNKRGSSSSDEILDTSDEVDKLPLDQINLRNQVNQFIADNQGLVPPEVLEHERPRYRQDEV